MHAYSIALQLDRIGQPEAVASVHFEVHWVLVMAVPCKRADGFELGRRPRSYLAIWWAVRKHDDGGWAADVLEHAADDRCHGVSHRDFSCTPVSGVGGS